MLGTHLVYGMKNITNTPVIVVFGYMVCASLLLGVISILIQAL